jgi:hypothetical protein
MELDHYISNQGAALPLHEAKRLSVSFKRNTISDRSYLADIAFSSERSLPLLHFDASRSLYSLLKASSE